jgi:hypothetical protein
MMAILQEIFTTADDFRNAMDEQDYKFIQAMSRAVAQGLEHPPMLGVDTRPCTTRPRSYQPLRRS